MSVYVQSGADSAHTFIPRIFFVFYIPSQVSLVTFISIAFYNMILYNQL